MILHLNNKTLGLTKKKLREVRKFQGKEKFHWNDC